MMSAVWNWTIVSPSVCATGTGMRCTVFPVHVDRHRGVVGHNRERHRRRGNTRGAVGAGVGLHEAGAQVLARKNRRAHLAQVLVAARVIAVEVRVDHEANPAVRDLLDGRHELLGHGRELRIDHQDAVRTGEHADHAAVAFERVEVVRDLGRLDLDVRRLLSAAGHREIRQDNEQNGRTGRAIEGSHSVADCSKESIRVMAEGACI